MGRPRQEKPARSGGPNPAALILLAAIAPTLVFGLAAGGSEAGGSGAASFDCGQARTVAEKMICADPALAAAEAAIAANCAAALKGLNSPARKALAEEQRAFISYRDRAAFVASVNKPNAGFVGVWKNVEGVTRRCARSGGGRRSEG